ncbi:MAG: hypothetical protein D6722_28380, partial [Bacteroidetes bacterium]
METIVKNWVLMLGLLVGISQPIQAGNNCITATPLVVGAGGCSWGTAAPVALGGACPDPVGLGLAGCGGGCDDQAWFRLQINDNTAQYDLAFTIDITNTGAGIGEYTYYLLYAEGSDSGNGDPCSWISPAGPGAEAFHLRRAGQSGCINIGAGNTGQVTYDSYGLDGSAIYYLVIERVSGFGGSVDICANTIGSGPPPSEDRCGIETLTSTNGIDSQAALGGSGTWADAYLGTNQYAKKQRITNECNVTTEDHYFTGGPGICEPNHALGDDQKVIWPFPPITDDFVESLESTVFYGFQIAITDPTAGWYLHLGNTNCGASPDSLEVMLVSQWDCANAGNTMVDTVLFLQPTGTYPNPDLSFGPFSLTPLTDYAIIIDGVNGSQCSYQLLLTTAASINPVLPARIESFAARAAADQVQLSWEAADATAFTIERSADGATFGPVGSVSAPTEALMAYTYTDLPPATGATWYYRLRATDADGHETSSEMRQVVLSAPTLGLAVQGRQGDRLRLEVTLPRDLPATVE